MKTIAPIASAVLLASAFGLFPSLALAQTDQTTPTAPPSGLSTNTPGPYPSASESPAGMLVPGASPTVNPMVTLSPTTSSTTTTTTVSYGRPSGLWGLLGLLGLFGFFGLGGGRRSRVD